jgi:TP901 family phage tail tape measure protein
VAIANLVVRISADIADFEKSFAGLGRTLQRQGRDLENIGSRLTQGLTLPLAGLAAVAAKAAISFESSFAGVRKTVDATEGQFKELEQGFRNLAKTMPLSVNEINRVAEAAGQLGIGRTEILAFTQTMVKLGATTNLSAEEAATGMAQFANALGQPKINAEQLASALVALGNNGASTEKQILDMAGRIAGAGAQIKLTAGSIFGMSNALASVGIDAEKGGSAISRLFNDLNSAVSEGGKELKNFAAVAGQSAESFRSLFRQDSATAISKFIEGLHAQKAAGTDLLKVLNELGITELRYRDTVLLAANAGPQFAASIRLGNQAFNEGTAATKEYNERLKTTESQLKILRGNVNDVAITLGQAFLPLINDAVQGMRPFVESMANLATGFKELPEPIRNSTAAILGLVAAIGPLTFAVGKVQQAWAAMLSVLGSGALSSTVSLLGRFAGPIALVTAAVIALKETYEAFNRSLTDGLRTLASALPGFTLLEVAVTALHDLFPALGDVMDDIVSIVKNGLIVAFREVGKQLENAADVLIKTLNPAWDAAANAFERIGDVVQRVVVPALAAAVAQLIAMIPGVRGLADFAGLLPGMGDMAAALDRTAKALEQAAGSGRDFAASTGQMSLRVQTGDKALDDFRASMTGLFSATTKASDAIGGIVKPLKSAKELAEVNKKIAAAQIPLTTSQKEQTRTLLELGLSVSDISTKLGASEIRIKAYADQWEDLQRLISQVIPRINADINSLPIDPFNSASRTLGTAIPNVRGSSLMAPLVAALERDFAGIDLAALKARNAIKDFGDTAADNGNRAAEAAKNALNGWDVLALGLNELSGSISGLGGGFVRWAAEAVSAFAAVQAGAITTAAAISSIATAGIGFLISAFAMGAAWQPQRVDENRLNGFDQFGGQDAFERAARMAGVAEERIRLLRRAIEFDMHGLFDREFEFISDAIEEAHRRIDELGNAAVAINDKAERFSGPFRKIFEEIANADTQDAEQSLRAKMAAMAQAGQAEFERLGIFVTATFAAMVTETGDAIGAIRQLGPAFQTLKDGVEDFGLTSTATIDQLISSFNLINDETFGPILESIQTTGKIFTSLQSAGYLTAELFQTVSDDIGASFRELEAKGGDVAKAMALSQPVLQRLWEAQKKFGTATDETTAALLRQAEEQGLVGEHMRDVNQQILHVLIAIADVFGAEIPDALREMSSAATDAAEEMQNAFGNAAGNIQTDLDRIRAPKITIPVDFDINNPDLAREDIRPFNLSGGEGTAYAPSSSSYPDASATFVMQVDGRTLAEATVPYIPGEVQRFGLA